VIHLLALALALAHPATAWRKMAHRRKYII
jgi:hypothetical protein